MFGLFSKPTPERLAADELQEARRQLLAWQTEYDNAHYRVSYYESKIRRLTAFLAKENYDPEQHR